MRCEPSQEQQGAALVLVLVFSVFAMATAAVYVLGQMQVTHHALSRPQAVQARLNAYSGVQWALDRLRDSTLLDTLNTINTLDTLFHSRLFARAADTASARPEFLPLDGEPVTADLFGVEGFGDAVVARRLSGAVFEIVATGRFREHERRVRAELGCRWTRPRDTLLYLREQSSPVRTVTGGLAVGRFDPAMVNERFLDEIVEAFRREIADTQDAAIEGLPLAVTSREALGRVGEVVPGSLLLDGSFGGFSWREQERRVRVGGDLQVTGDVSVEGVRFFVAGEVKLFDKARMRRVSIMAAGRVILGEESSFSGDILSFASIRVSGEADVRERSTLVTVNGRPAGRKSTTSGPANSAGVRRPPTTETSWAVAILDNARVDGAVAAVGPTADANVRIDSQAVVNGIVFAGGGFCLLGKMKGVAAADRIVDCTTGAPAAPGIRSVAGDIWVLPEIGAYRLPAFLGKPTVMRWHEETL